MNVFFSSSQFGQEKTMCTCSSYVANNVQTRTPRSREDPSQVDSLKVTQSVQFSSLCTFYISISVCRFVNNDNLHNVLKMCTLFCVALIHS